MRTTVPLSDPHHLILNNAEGVNMPPPASLFCVPINNKITEGVAPPSGQSRLNLNVIPNQNKKMVIPSGFMEI